MAGVLFSGGPFRIATFVPDVTLEAVGQDALGITGAPVETGATMSDHSFKLPVRLEMLVGWSDSSAGRDGYIREIYRKLLSLQATRLPFTLYTSRRMYPNMLMESLTDPITPRTMYAMVPRITFRELIISRTQTASANTAQPASNPANQENPANTGAVVDRGTVTGQTIGSQAFAGSYNPGDYSGGTGASTFSPGSYNADGTPATGQTFIGNGMTLPSADPPIAQSPNLSGISPPTAITLPEISVTTLRGVGGLQAAGPDQYAVFGSGP